MSTAATLQSTAAESPFVSLSSHAGLLLQRKCACGGPASTSLSGECDACKNKRFQTKLSIGASNDPLEQEADRIADQVLAAPAPSTVSDTPPRIQRYAGQATEHSEAVPASVDHVLANSGNPLEPALRQDMEQRFGHDFSRVRIHSGTVAEQSAQDVHANAYTVGHHIVFGAGRFAPGTHEGQRLIAHELTHVLQQTGMDGTHSAQKYGSLGPSAAVLRKEPAGPQQAASPPSPCKSVELPKIQSAITTASQWLEYEIIPSLDWYMRFLPTLSSAEKQKFRGDISEALKRHFAITDPQSQQAHRLLANLKNISRALSAKLIFNCPGEGRCGGENAHVDPVSGLISFCAPFLKETDMSQRVVTLIHELAHAHAKTAVAGSAGAADLASLRDRSYSSLSADEALNNADSYAAFVLELATAKVQQPRQAMDTLKQCPAPLFPQDSIGMVRKALIRVEQWNNDTIQMVTQRGPVVLKWLEAIRGKYFTGNMLPDFTYLAGQYLAANRALQMNLTFECSQDCKQTARIYYKDYWFWGPGDTMYLCPSWFMQANEQVRAKDLYRAILWRYTYEQDADKLFAFALEVAPILGVGRSTASVSAQAPPSPPPASKTQTLEEKVKETLDNSL
jgi:hypothetical protein